GANVTLVDCQFTGNKTGQGGDGITKNGSSGRGGGIGNYGSNFTVVNTKFTNNETGPGGAGSSWGGDSGAGGAIFNDVINMTLVGCTFSGNKTGIGGEPAGHAGDGGGVVVWSGGDNLRVDNCLFEGNQAGDGAASPGGEGGMGGEGGGVSVSHATGVQITNSTFHGNQAGAGGSGNVFGDDGEGGGLYKWSGGVTIVNSIFWANKVAGGSGTTSGEQLNGGSVSFSCVRGWSGTSNGNTGADPLLDSAFRLTTGSPCIDTGSYDGVANDRADWDGDSDTAEKVPFDLDGNDRIVDGPLPAPDAGTATVDMGAYEIPTAGY
ncbi:MAG: hypothetical protein GY842_22770, partial [bacterium]|nr:hypothetical protein [bacterium]